MKKVVYITAPFVQDGETWDTVGQLAEEFGLPFDTVNAEDNPDILREYHIVALPVTMIFDEATLLKTIHGAVTPIALRTIVRPILQT